MQATNHISSSLHQIKSSSSLIQPFPLLYVHYQYHQPLCSSSSVALFLFSTLLRHLTLLNRSITGKLSELASTSKPTSASVLSSLHKLSLSVWFQWSWVGAHLSTLHKLSLSIALVEMVWGLPLMPLHGGSGWATVFEAIINLIFFLQ